MNARVHDLVTAVIVLGAAIMLLESGLQASARAIASERMPTAPLSLTAEQVFEAAGARGRHELRLARIDGVTGRTEIEADPDGALFALGSDAQAEAT